MPNDVSMASVIVPRSDQINADDLLAGPITITITRVTVAQDQEQPVSIYFEGSDKAYRPCKSMARVLVNAWGPNASKYHGRSLTLYCDPKVKWGGMEVGGIRISHMSHIDAAMTMALTVTRANKKPFTVKPLVVPEAPKDSGAAAGDARKLINVDQVTELEQLCKEGGKDLTAAFLQRAEIETFDYLPANRYKSAKQWITDQRLAEHEGTQA